MYVYNMYMWCPRTPEEGGLSSGPGITGGREPIHGCQELKLSQLQEKQMLLAPETTT